MVDRIFHKIENGLSREGGLAGKGHSRQVLLYSEIAVSLSDPPL